ncbi:MAG: FkbM family methyltransferase [Candidatus Adiutrix sp.]|nr:FkbM family methyltransferase [Candidatus Adiutrix sp.]
MNRRLMQLEADDFTNIMDGYAARKVQFRNCIDGGAAAGHTARQMLPYLREDGLVYAFEPFPGNFRFLDAIQSERIQVVKKALYFETVTKDLFVGHTVAKDSAWARRGMEGYSSAGYLVDAPNAKGSLKNVQRPPDQLFSVSCVPADEAIGRDRPIDFVKLDLQGGELNALMGMKRIIFEPHFLWIEFSDQAGLLDYLYDLGFIIFETTYLLRGHDPSAAAKDFVFIKKGNLSSGNPVWLGRRITPWGRDFHDEFMLCKTKYSLVQTDIVCVHATRYQAFNRAVALMS